MDATTHGAGRELEALFRHTSNAGEKANVLREALNLGCRMLPGYTTEDLLGELQDIAGPNLELPAIDFQPRPWSSALKSTTYSPAPTDNPPL